MATNVTYLVELTIALASLDGFDDFAAYLDKMDHTRSKRISKLFDYLRKHYTAFDEEAACYFVLGKSDLNLPAWRKLRNNLTVVLEKYVLTEKMYREEAQRLRAKLELGRDLHLENIFAKTEKKALKLIPNKESKRYKYLAETTYLIYFRDKDTIKPKDEKLLEDCAKNQDIAYVIHRLVVAVEQLWRRRLNKVSLSEITEKLQPILLLARPIDVPLVRLLVIATDYFLSPDHTNYLQFKEAFIELLPRINSLRHTIYLFLLNALPFSKFEGDLIEEYHDLHKLGIEKGLLLYNKKIRSVLFFNIVIIAYTLEELNFLEKFIKEYKPSIRSGRLTASIVKLAHCYLLFCKKKYKDVLCQLPEVENTIPSFTLVKQILELKALYEYHDNKYDAFVEIDKRDKRFWNLIGRHKKDGHLSERDHLRNRRFYTLLVKTASFDKSSQSKSSLIELYDFFKGEVAEVRWLRKIIERLP